MQALRMVIGDHDSTTDLPSSSPVAGLLGDVSLDLSTNDERLSQQVAETLRILAARCPEFADCAGVIVDSSIRVRIVRDRHGCCYAAVRVRTLPDDARRWIAPTLRHVFGVPIFLDMRF